MPKKRHVYPQAKPTAAAHPSLSSTSKCPATSNEPNTSSVNEKLLALRIEQRSKKQSNETVAAAAGSSLQHRALPPALQEILQIPPSLPPRPRASLVVRGGRRRGLAGPPAPGSWMIKRTKPHQTTEGVQNPRDGLYDDARLPGLQMARERSLADMVCKRLVRDWETVFWYEQRNLGLLPVKMKEILLGYLAMWNPGALDLKGLRVLFMPDSETQEQDGNLSVKDDEKSEHPENPTIADLSSLLGYTITFDDLKTFFKAPAKGASAPAQGLDEIPDSWDAESPLLTQGLAAAPFANLAQLSLGRPAASITWPMLLDLAPHLGLLTHLSLVYWPRPDEHPNSHTAHFDSPRGTVQSSADHFYSAYDGDYSGPARVLRKLSRHLPCLTWLDLTGNTAWIPALWQPTFRPLWHGAWASLDTVVIAQGVLPTVFSRWPLERDEWDAEIDAFEASIARDGETALKQFRAWREIEHQLMLLDGYINNEIFEILDLFAVKASGRAVSNPTERHGRIFSLADRRSLLQKQGLDEGAKPLNLLDKSNRVRGVDFVYTSKDSDKAAFLNRFGEKLGDEVGQSMTKFGEPLRVRRIASLHTTVAPSNTSGSSCRVTEDFNGDSDDSSRTYGSNPLNESPDLVIDLNQRKVAVQEVQTGLT